MADDTGRHRGAATEARIWVLRRPVASDPLLWSSSVIGLVGAVGVAVFDGGSTVGDAVAVFATLAAVTLIVMGSVRAYRSPEEW